jgi:pyruvate/2-oxoacid:ferredoxin oxidoreductase beta subunit
MSLYKLLKNPDFEERYNIETTVALRDAYSKYPYHSAIPSMTLYHKKPSLTESDVQGILEWHNNLQEIKKGSIPHIAKKKGKEVKRENANTQNCSFLTQEEIEARDLLIKKETEFRNKIVEEYFREEYRKASDYEEKI